MHKSLLPVALVLCTFRLVMADADRADRIRISRLDCQRLVPHVVRPDVRYRPGVGVRGEHVVPPDLKPRTRLHLPDSYAIAITVDLCERLDPETRRRLCRRKGNRRVARLERYDAELYAGTVTVAGNGRRVYFNGQPLNDEETEIVREACQRRMDKHFRSRPE